MKLNQVLKKKKGVPTIQFHLHTILENENLSTDSEIYQWLIKDGQQGGALRRNNKGADGMF